MSIPNPVTEAFRLEGRDVAFSPNRPLRLDGRDEVFLLAEGSVDLFAVATEAGATVGARFPLHRIEGPNLLMGLGMFESAATPILLAVPDSHVRALSLPRARFLPLLGDPERTAAAEALLGAWISGLAAGRSEGLSPRDAVTLEAGPPATLEPGKTARVSHGMLWVSPTEGALALVGREEAVIRAETPPIPLAAGMWLRALEPATLNIETLAEYATRAPGLDGLAHVHRMIATLVAVDLDRRTAEEADRRSRQTEHERKALQAAMHDIATLMTETRDEVAKDAAPGEGPLLIACRMVGAAQGMTIRPPTVRDDCDRDDMLEAIARASRMRIRKVLLAGPWWREDHGPLLGFHKDGDRPCALLQEGQKRTIMCDPETRTGLEVDAAAAGELAPFAYQFYRPLPDGPVSAVGLIRFAATRIRRDLLAVAVLGGLSALLGLAIPVGTGIVYNTLIPEAARGQMLQLVAALLAIAASATLLDVVKGLALLRIETRTDADVQASVMDRLLTLPVSFFCKFSSGDLTQRALGMAVIRDTVTLSSVQSGIAGIFAVANLALMFWYDAGLALVASAFLVGGGAILTSMAVLKVKRIWLMTDIEGRIAGMILQFINGIAKLRVAGAEKLAFARWAHEFSRQRRCAYRYGKLMNLQTLFNAIYPALGLLLLFAWTSANAPAALRAGSFVAFLAAYTNVQIGLFQLFTALSSTLEAVPLFERMQPILRAEPELDETKAPPGELSGEIEVSAVTFRYQEDGPEILRDVAFAVSPGQFVALVGASGSGKSTLLRLLLGFEQPRSGGIYYDGKDFSTLDCREVRRQIGVVLQGGSVVPGSILDNIRGAVNHSLDDVWAAARMAGMEQDIRDMPMGLHTFVAPGGENLSGGQRQRLLIARALIRKPRILFFDEATSALDNRTQETVSESLAGLRASRVVIAHRLSTVMQADCIHVLEKGRIVESGRYDELIKRDGPFAALVKRQMV